MISFISSSFWTVLLELFLVLEMLPPQYNALESDANEKLLFRRRFCRAVEFCLHSVTRDTAHRIQVMRKGDNLLKQLITRRRGPNPEGWTRARSDDNQFVRNDVTSFSLEI